MLWLCLLPRPRAPQTSDGAGTPGTDQAGQWQLQAAWCLLRFTPRVALLHEAVVAEVAGSERLFSGQKHLFVHVSRDLSATYFVAMGAGESAHAALARARTRRSLAENSAHSPDSANPPESMAAPTGFAALAAAPLGLLPLATLTAAGAHAAMLERAGFRTLGDLQALPRGPLARRFGAPLLLELDHTFGLQPEAFTWVTLPEVFDQRLELPGRVDSAPQLLFAATRLLAHLHTWLAARRSGVKTIELRWRHDFAAQSAGPGGALSIRTATAARDVKHLERLLRERLAHTTLAGPVGEIALHAVDVEALVEDSDSFLPNPQAQGEGVQQLLERLSARLGADQVLAPQLQADWRMEHAQRWVAAQDRKTNPKPPPKGKSAGGVASSVSNSAPISAPNHELLGTWPQPSFMLTQPLPLLVRQHKPIYQGPLTLLAGPQRVEAAWWATAAPSQSPPDRSLRLGPDPQPSASPTVVRDYFLAYSAQAGLLWIFKERLPSAERQQGHFQWALHGVFA